MNNRSFPPLDGSITVPETVDFNAKYNPYEPVFIFSEEGKKEITRISQLEFGRSADRVAHCVRPGRVGPDGQVIAFVALLDTLLYQTVMMGIMRAGLVPFPISHRNSPAAIKQLIKETSCHRLLTTRENVGNLIETVHSELSSELYELSVEEIPPFQQIFPKLGEEKLEDPFLPYPRASVRPSVDNILLYFHSSGSTRLPKSISHTFKSMADCSNFPTITENRHREPKLVMSAMHLPPFHSLAFYIHLFLPLYNIVPVALYPPTALTRTSLPMTPTPGNILDHTIRTGCNSMVTFPALLQAWANDVKAVKTLASLQFVAYGGGAVPSKLGNFLTENGVNILGIYGATEFGAISCALRREGDEKDWDYTSFPDRVRIRWDPQGDGTYECQILTWENHQVAVENLSDTKGYATSDLWVRHPTKPYLWKIVGRKDDVVVHTSGEKTVPAPIEDILMSSPYFSGVVIFGRNHDQTGVLVELKPEYSIDIDDEEEVIRMRNVLWPVVEEANRVAPAFSRIFKEMILFSSPSKPLPRAGKGTIMRKAALSAYDSEIETMYARVEGTAKTVDVIPPQSWGVQDTAAWLKTQIEDMYDKKSFFADDDLFDQGMDSLGATILRRRIVGALHAKETKKAAQLISQTTVYTYSSIKKLAEFLSAVIADTENFIFTSKKTESMDLMIEKYLLGLKKPLGVDSETVNVADDGAVVLLTGSTGSLGSQILDSLLKDSRVKTIYTLNRPSSSQSLRKRHVERFLGKGFDTTLLDSQRLIFLEGESSHCHLGLKADVYDNLQKAVTIIIHNAWKVDFNLPLSSFEVNIQGTRNLIDFARSSRNSSSLRFIFTSSIASASSWDKARGAYPEEVVSDAKYAVGKGYGESKYIAERILSQSGIQTTSLRIGQISGSSPNGSWATTDWVPNLVKSSIRLGALPSAPGYISWLPMDTVSSTILDVVFTPRPAPQALNIVHPHPISWNVVMEYINEAIVEEGISQSKLPFVDFPTWFSMLEKYSEDASEETLKDIPAIKLIDVFRETAQMSETIRVRGLEDVEATGSASFDTNIAQAISNNMKHLPTLGQANALAWVKHWKSVGLF